MIAKAAISVLIGYAFGCIQSAYLLGRLFGKLDIREHGSGNAGASNITTIMGVKYGALVGISDVIKGLAAVLIVKGIFPQNPELAFLSGLMAIIGHVFPFYLKFRGGKGVAALIGMMFGLDWKLGVLFVLLLAIPALVTDYIVIGSFTVFTALPVVTYLLGYPVSFVVGSAGLTALIFYLHRGNIKRIIAGDETRIRAVLFKK